jgi:hypothetical protein
LRIQKIGFLSVKNDEPTAMRKVGNFVVCHGVVGHLLAGHVFVSHVVVGHFVVCYVVVSQVVVGHVVSCYAVVCHVVVSRSWTFH